MANSKAKKAHEMLAPLATVMAVATESKTQKKPQSTAETAMHPIEEMCRKEFAARAIEASIKKAEISAKDLKNVYFKNSKEKASEFVVMCAIAPYLDIMKERPKQIGSWRDKRNQLVHALFNKDPQAVILELQPLVEQGYNAVRKLDNAVKQLKRSKIRERFKMG